MIVYRFLRCVVGFFSFRKSRPDPGALLTDTVERLQAGLVSQLTLSYHGRFAPVEALRLATCVVCYAQVVDPPNSEQVEYAKANRELVKTEARQLASREELRQAASYLYAALTLLSVVKTGQPFSPQAATLGARAAELGIYIPNTFDVCGTGDGWQCMQALNAFAQKYLDETLDQKPGGPGLLGQADAHLN